MKKLLIFLSQGFEEVEAAAFIDVFGWSRVTKGVTPVESVTVGLHKKIKATHSLTVIPDKLLVNIDPVDFDAFAMPGGFHDKGFTEAYEEPVLSAMRTIHDLGGYIATICVGARPAAHAGLLKDKEAVTYPLDNGTHIEYIKNKGAEITTGDLCVSNRVITSTGPATAFKVALKLFELMNGVDELALLKTAMMFR